MFAEVRFRWIFACPCLISVGRLSSMSYVTLCGERCVLHSVGCEAKNYRGNWKIMIIKIYLPEFIIIFFFQKLRRGNALKAINDAMDKGINLRTIGIPEIRHFLYKSKSNAQLLCSEISAPYHTAEEFTRLEALYYDIHHRIHNTNRPLKLIYQLQEKEIVLAWVRVLFFIDIDTPIHM